MRKYLPSEKLPPQTMKFDTKLFDAKKNNIDFKKIKKIILCSDKDIENQGNDATYKIVISNGNKEEIFDVLEKIKIEIDNQVPVVEIEPSAIVLELLR